jgi:hypothetical protein
VGRRKEIAIQGPERALRDPYASWEAYCRAHPPAAIKGAQSKIEALTGIKRRETQVRASLKQTSISAVAVADCPRPKPTPTGKRALWPRSGNRA